MIRTNSSIALTINHLFHLEATLTQVQATGKEQGSDYSLSMNWKTQVQFLLTVLHIIMMDQKVCSL